ncbi:hypothetical protein ACVWW1_008845 [Bradyrhizobium sp. JR3.5]
MNSSALSFMIFVAPFCGIVLPGKGDVILVEGDEPAVGDSNAMGIAAEIGQHLRGATERPFGVDDPADASHGDEVSCEGSRLGQGCEVAEEVQGAGVEGGGQTFEEQASEQPGERFDGQEEVWSAGDPARAIGLEAAARHDAVDVGMVRQCLPPGVEDGDDADHHPHPAADHPAGVTSSDRRSSGLCVARNVSVATCV